MSPLSGAKPVIIIATRDRARSLPFYTGTLGLKLISEDPFAAVLDVAGAPLRLSTIADWTPHPHTVFGFSVPDIVATVAALSKAGLEFLKYDGFGQDAHGIWTAPDGNAKVAWFNDPDGNNLSLTQFG